MSLQRPRHLAARSIRGSGYSEQVKLIRVVDQCDEWGRPQADQETTTDSLAATYPPIRRDPRVREVLDKGVRLSALRMFCTVETLDPAREGESAGDIIEWMGERWRVAETARWDGFSEHLTILQ